MIFIILYIINTLIYNNNSKKNKQEKINFFLSRFNFHIAQLQEQTFCPLKTIYD